MGSFFDALFNNPPPANMAGAGNGTWTASNPGANPPVRPRPVGSGRFALALKRLHKPSTNVVDKRGDAPELDYSRLMQALSPKERIPNG